MMRARFSASAPAPPNSISLPLSGVSKISVTESQPKGAVGFQIPCAIFIAHDSPCNYQWTWYVYDCLSSFWSKHHVLTLNVGDAGSCAFAFDLPEVLPLNGWLWNPQLPTKNQR